MTNCRRLKCYEFLNLLKAGLDVMTARFGMKLVTHFFLICVHLCPSVDTSSFSV